MKYDVKEIESIALWRWKGDDYYVLSYPPTRKRTIATDFILDFKTNHTEAVTIATGLILVALKKIEPILRGYQCRYIVSLPPSRAGRTNVPCEQVCAAVEQEFRWLEHLPKALRRTKSVRKSAWAGPGQRPTYDDHKESIQYAGTISHQSGSFIMLDDVITKGSVSSACRDILTAMSKCKRVIGLFLGRTE